MSKKQPISNIAAALRSIVERIEKLEEEKSGIAADIRDIYREAKGNGLDTNTIREMVKLRELDANKRAEKEFNRDVYLRALGLIDDLS